MRQWMLGLRFAPQLKLRCAATLRCGHPLYMPKQRIALELTLQ
jgi:hypothetical protein